MTDHDHDDEECTVCAHGPAEYKRRMMENIERTGLSITGVMADEENPGFVYTIGLHRSGLPDLIMFSVPPEYGMRLMNYIYKEAKEGRFELKDGAVIDDPKVVAMPLVLRETDPSKVEDYATGSYRLSIDETGTQNRVLQVVWPDKNSRYPWEPDFDSQFLKSQVRLWMTRN